MPVLKNIFGVGELNYGSSDWVTTNWLTVTAGETGSVLIIGFGRVSAGTDTSHQLSAAGTESYRWRGSGGWDTTSWGLL